MAEEQCPVWEYLDAGEALVTAAEWPEAIVLYQEGLKHYPDCPELHRALGVVQEQIGDSLGQRSSYQRAIELEPEQPVWVYMTLAYLLKQQGAFVEAIEVYQCIDRCWLK